MDEEAQQAINEALHIFEETKHPEPQPPTAPIDTLPTQEQPPEQQSDAQEPEEPPVVAELERETDTRPRKRSKRHWLGLAGLMAGIISVTVIVMLVILPLLHPTATVTIIPAVATITATGTVEAQGRSLAPVTASQAKTVPATGTGHQDARAAQGTITFYNGYTAAQVIPAGTLLQTASGVQIVTDTDAYVPAASPPMQGQATVLAHALQTGPAGNIKAYSIYGACCRAYILAANTAEFTDGQEARLFQVVTQNDIDNAQAALKRSLMQSMDATFRAQLQQGEVFAPPDCKVTPISDHKAGEEGTQVNVTVTASCSAEAYQTGDMQAQATRILTAAANEQLGDGYTVTGDPHVTVTSASARESLLRLTVKVQGTMAYQFSQAQLQTIKSHIAGMDKADAAAWLARQRGVKAASIDVSGPGATLPQDTSVIRCAVLYMA